MFKNEAVQSFCGCSGSLYYSRDMALWKAAIKNRSFHVDGKLLVLPFSKGEGAVFRFNFSKPSPLVGFFSLTHADCKGLNYVKKGM